MPDELLKQVEEASTAWRVTLEGVREAAPELFAGRQEGPDNFLGIIDRMNAQAGWLAERVASLVAGPDAVTTTPEGIARRRFALQKALDRGDQKTAQQIRADLIALGVKESDIG